MAARRFGSSCTRTAYFCCPPTCTCATSGNVEMRCASRFSAYSSTFEIGNVADDSVRMITDESAGFTLRNDGGVGMSDGRFFEAAAMAVCTSCAAASMLRSSANCIVICAVPSLATELIESSDAMVENCFSSGVATAVAIVSGLAPGRLAVT